MSTPGIPGGLPLGSLELAGCDRGCEEALWDLWAAGSRTALLRELLPQGPGGSTTHHWEIPALMRRHRSRGGLKAEMALLLLTSWRWSRCTSRAVTGAAALLPDTELDSLALALLPAGQLKLRFPIGLTRLSPRRGKVRFVSLDGALPDVVLGRDALVPVGRSVAPPLRRFAVARALGRDLIPGGLEAALDLSQRLRRDRRHSLEALGAGAVVAGCLDAADHLDGEELARLLDVALKFPQAQVRKLALARLKALGRGDEARRRGRRDPDAGIREWAARDPDPLPF